MSDVTQAPPADQTRAVSSYAGRLTRCAVLGSWLVVALAALCAPLLPALPPVLLYAPLLLSVLLLGLPHGAVDHLVVLQLAGRRMGLPVLMAVLTAYLALAAAYLAVWWLAPLAAFTLFILLTAYHWGQGELHALLALHRARHLPTPTLRMAALVLRGALPMLVPLLAFPAVYAEVAGDLTLRFAPGDAPTFDALLTPPMRATLALLLGAALTAYFAGTYRLAGRDGRTAWWIDLGETLGLVLLFVGVHPLLAVGLFFACWHAPRHIVRLTRRYDRRGPSLMNRPGAAFLRFTGRALPLTLAAVTLLGGLYLAVPAPPTTLAGFVGLYLVLIAALTLPHAAVVTWMDRREQVWAGDPAA